jgi:hypothetical protein
MQQIPRRAQRSARTKKRQARYRLGAVSVTASRASEQQYCSARLDEIRYTEARLSDTAALLLVMGDPQRIPTQTSGRHHN